MATLRLGRVLGIEVRVDGGLALVFALVAMNLAGVVLPAWHPTWHPALCWAIALAAATLFFASIWAHELSHALVGRRFGMQVDRITLFVFGGVANLTSEPRSPGAEAAMAAVGPLTSIAIGAAALLAGARLAPDLRGAGPLATLLLWLGPVNLVLGLFNLVPGFPLDGGRVLRAALWRASGDFQRATRWAALTGQGFASLLVASGVGMVLGIHVPFLGGGAVQGLWLVFLGVFLNGAAAAAHRRARGSAARAEADLPGSTGP